MLSRMQLWNVNPVCPMCVHILTDCVSQAVSREQEQITKFDLSSPLILHTSFLLMFAVLFCFVEQILAGIILTMSCTCSVRWVFLPLPSSLLNSWLGNPFDPCCSLWAGSTSPYTRDLHTLSLSSAGGDSCVCNIKNSLSCIPTPSFSSCSERVGGGQPAVLYRSHLYWTRAGSICKSVRSGQAHMSHVIS